jgi:protein involved in polysaccharide export with SLBB domain
MKAVNNFWAFCIAVLIANFTFVSGQQAIEDKTNKKVPEQNLTTEGKNDAEQPPQTAANLQNPYKNQTNEKYRIGFQDTLEVQVFRHPELSQVVNVSPDGTIRLPRIEKPIIAVCKTEGELAESITTHFKSYLKNPFVTVRATEQRSQPFAVVGAVQKPGSFYLNRKIRLLELLAFAGGPDVEHAGSRIQVARVGNITACREQNDGEDDGEVEFLGFNLNEVLKGKENPWMQPGDIVSVLIAEEAYVVGSVKEPVKIVLKDQKTLTQAIAEAGGLSGTAKTDKVIIQRQEPGANVKTELAFNLKEIRDRKIPDPVLQGNDIVVVGSDKLKSIGSEFFKIFKQSVPIVLY